MRAVFQPFASGSDIFDRALLGHCFHVRHDGREVVIFPFKARAGTMVEFWSDGYIAFAGEPFRNVSKMGVYSESFLENEQSWILGVSRWTRYICIHYGPIVHFQRDSFGHNIFHYVSPLFILYGSILGLHALRENVKIYSSLIL